MRCSMFPCTPRRAPAMWRITFYPELVLFLLISVWPWNGTAATLKGDFNCKIPIYWKFQTNVLKYLLPLNLLERLTPGTIKCASREQDWKLISCFISCSEWIFQKKKMSQLAPELILLTTLLEVTVKSFKVSQTGMRKKISPCFCVFAICGCQKRLDIHLKVTSRLTNTCSLWPDFNSFLSGDLATTPLQTPQQTQADIFNTELQTSSVYHQCFHLQRREDVIERVSKGTREKQSLFLFVRLKSVHI